MAQLDFCTVDLTNHCLPPHAVTHNVINRSSIGIDWSVFGLYWASPENTSIMAAIDENRVSHLSYYSSNDEAPDSLLDGNIFKDYGLYDKIQFNGTGNEFMGRHYALVVGSDTNDEYYFVLPITSKRKVGEIRNVTINIGQRENLKYTPDITTSFVKCEQLFVFPKSTFDNINLLDEIKEDENCNKRIHNVLFALEHSNLH